MSTIFRLVGTFHCYTPFENLPICGILLTVTQNYILITIIRQVKKKHAGFFFNYCG